MIRRAQLTLMNANKGKLSLLAEVMQEALRVANADIALMWNGADKRTYSMVKQDTWLTARMQQCLWKQAAEAVASQRKRKKKTMPVVRKEVLNLDERFLTYTQDANSFDFWVKFASIGKSIILKLPSRKHAHFNSFVDDGWTMRKGGRLRHNDKGWFLDVYFEKEAPPAVLTGDAIGVDVGYKTLLAVSTGESYDAGLEQVYEKIARKKQNSKAFKRALTERDMLVNRTVNTLPLEGVNAVVVEDLVNVKHKSKGRMRKEFNNKLQRWTYPKVLDKLQSVCEMRGIAFTKVDPAYTSQTCSSCGLVDKTSRKGKTFCCARCGLSMDADINAAVNIRLRGAYSPPSNQLCHEIPWV